MTPTRRFPAARPTSRAARLLDEVVDATFDGPDPLDSPGAGEDDGDGDLLDALAYLEQRVAGIEKALIRVRVMGEPTLAPHKPWPAPAAGRPPADKLAKPGGTW